MHVSEAGTGVTATPEDGMSSIGFRVRWEIDRPDPSVVGVVAKHRSCDLSDVMNRANTMVGISPIYRPIAAFAGPAVTVSVPAGGINMVKLGMAATRPGDVLVVSAQGYDVAALWGGNLSLGLKSRGVVGAVFDGAVRDVTEIRALAFPIHARSVVTAAADLEAPRGEVNVPIACGGVVVFPGDIVVADEDGIVVVPANEAESLSIKVDELTAHHAAAREVLGRGEVTFLDQIKAQLAGRGMAVD
jgi:4-hydroxy-4-methyl-2-oxoglutarate aldolase